MKTSTRLSWNFTAITAGVLLLFALVINGLFFYDRYTYHIDQMDRFSSIDTKRIRGQMRIPFERIKVFEKEVIQAEEQIQASWINHIYYYDDEWLMIREASDDTVLVADISPSVHRQFALVRLSSILVLVSIVCSRLLSRQFARRALRDVTTIAQRTSARDIHNLTHNLDLHHLPQDDEIRMIADSIDTMTSTLGTQVDQIKRFVSNITHEINTPLMTSRSHAELALKTGNYEQGLRNTIYESDQLHRLIDALTALHHSDHNLLENASISVESLASTLHDQVSRQYDKDISYQQIISDKLTIEGDEGAWEIVIRNLLDNAYKYAPQGGVITLTADATHIAIHNTGSSLNDAELSLIREPLRQADTSKGQDQGFGLGLSLVQTLIEKMGYDIEVVSDETGVTFFISL